MRSADVEGSRHLARVVRAPVSRVYSFVADPATLPQWAAGLAVGEVTLVGDVAQVDSPMGRVEVRFVAPNDLGVLDHEVTLPSGTRVTNHLRVLPHPDGSELVFTVRRGTLTDGELDADAGAVEADLARLARLLEADPTPEGPASR